MTKEEKVMLRRVKVGAILIFCLRLIDKETFADLMHFEKLPHERQKELVDLVDSLRPENK